MITEKVIYIKRVEYPKIINFRLQISLNYSTRSGVMKTQNKDEFSAVNFSTSKYIAQNSSFVNRLINKTLRIKNYFDKKLKYRSFYFLFFMSPFSKFKRLKI